MIAWIRSYLGASKKLLAQVLVLGVTAVVFAIGLMFVAGYLIAASADNAFSLLMLNIPLAFVQIFGLGKPLARYLERLRSHDWVLRLTSTLRLRLFGWCNTSSANRRTGERGDVLGFARERYRTRPESVLTLRFSGAHRVDRWRLARCGSRLHVARLVAVRAHLISFVVRHPSCSCRCAQSCTHRAKRPARVLLCTQR